VQVGVDGILYLKVLNPERASYGISDYLFAITQLAQTTLRSEVRKIDLDRTFEERSTINIAVVGELDKASEAWGVKVLRYEIKNIQPPADVLAAMEKQMRAEREKRGVILTSEGQRDAAINSAEGEKQRVIKASEANRQQQINEAEGQAQAILAVASDRGREQFGNLARSTHSVIVPATVSDLAGMVAAAMNVFGSSPIPAAPSRAPSPPAR
jgi:regulator of protease activity HflC (stomatin/prohibitin superfamily)